MKLIIFLIFCAVVMVWDNLQNETFREKLNSVEE
jgi:hypothetical protein